MMPRLKAIFSVRQILSSVLIVCLGFLSCELSPEPQPSIETQQPDIVFGIRGGYFPEYLGLEITYSGSATIKLLYPELTSVLQRATVDSVLNILRDFDSFQDSYITPAFDDYEYKITLRTPKRSKTVTFTSAALMANAELASLGQAVNKLLEIRTRVYYEKANWTGLVYSFGFSDSVYASSDTIIAQCRISNPTDLIRTVYFRNENELMIQFYSDDLGSNISGHIPHPAIAWGESTPSHSVEFLPGEQKTLTMHWNQSFVAADGSVYQSLPPGSYHAVINLLGAPGETGIYFRIGDFNFRITP